ncbi:MAG: hypothetical protein Q4B96_02935 [Bacillota bacterium]|nr:hypothetical protein [Bacillota bacterium]
MTKNSFIAAFRYMFKDMLSSVGVLCLVVALLFCAALAAHSNLAELDSEVGVWGVFEFSAMVMMLVIGIVSVREDTRMLLQNGVGRRTAFAALLAVCAAGSLLLAASGQLLLTLAHAVNAAAPGYINGFYYMLFEMNPPGELSAAGNMLVSFGGYMASALGGMMISLIFYRLPRFWSIVVAVAVPVMLFIGLPLTIGNTGFGMILGQGMTRLAALLLGSPLALLLGYAAAALIAGAAARLLLRHAPLK